LQPATLSFSIRGAGACALLRLRGIAVCRVRRAGVPGRAEGVLVLYVRTNGTLDLAMVVWLWGQSRLGLCRGEWELAVCTTTKYL